MNAKQVVEEIRRIIARSSCGEKELYEELVAEAEGWKMRLEELDDE